MTPLESSELRLSELFERHNLPAFQKIDTLSDLLGWLSSHYREWLPLSEEVIETIRPVVPESEIVDLLSHVATMETKRREATLRRLVDHLLMAGIPVELDMRNVPADIESSNEASFHMDSPAFTYQGKIYLDLQKVDEEAPIHEYTHLWATALRVSNPDEWFSIVHLMKESELWDTIAQCSPPGLTEDEIAEDVLATFSGRRGKERMTKLGLLENNPLIRAIIEFWRAVLSLFGRNFKTAEDTADQILHDFLSDVNPRETLQESDEVAGYDRLNEKRRDLFLGEKGISRMDQDNLFGSRMDNLHIAERMESQGEEARCVKIATGWERGVDGIWRYEIPPIQLKPLTRRKKAWKEGIPMENVLQAPDVFRSYPDLREITVKAVKMSCSAAYIPSMKTIELNMDELPLIDANTELTIRSESVKDRIREYLTHELQHHIQNKEGFATGSNCRQLAYYAQKAKEDALNEPDRSAMQLARIMNITENTKRTLDVVGPGFVVHYLSRLNQDRVGITEEMEERNAFIKKVESMTPEAFKALVVRAYKKRSTYIRWRRQCKEVVYPLYDKLAGEVEARNAADRIHLTDKERARTIGTDTMDYPANEQYLFFKRGKPIQVGDKAALENSTRSNGRNR